MRKASILALAWSIYLVGSAALVLFALFMNGWWVPIDIDQGGPVAEGWLALPVNIGLLLLFGVQHSVMARSGFKNLLTRPAFKGLERSAYILISALVLALVAWAWVPMPTLVWHVAEPVSRNILWALHGLGWVVLFVSTHLISHMELFGLSQAKAMADRSTVSETTFVTPGFYKLVRHPMMTGMLLLLWAAPSASQGRVLLATGLTVYIIIGTIFEERDLRRQIGAAYDHYCQGTPRFVPFVKRSTPADATTPR